MAWQFFDSNGNEMVVTAQFTVVDYGPPLDFNQGNLNTVGIADMMQSQWANDFMANTTTLTYGQSTSYVFPAFIPYPVSFHHVHMPMTNSVAASTTGVTTANTSITMSQMWTYNMHIYDQQQAGATNATSLSLLMSSSWGMTNQFSLVQGGVATSYSWSQKITYPVSNGTSANVYTTYSTSTNINSAAYLFSTGNITNFSGWQFLDLPWSTSLAAGNYYMAFGESSSIATQVAALSVAPRLASNKSFLGNSQGTMVFHEQGAATNSSIMFPEPLGSFSIAAGATTASLDVTRVSSQASHAVPLLVLKRTA